MRVRRRIRAMLCMCMPVCQPRYRLLVSREITDFKVEVEVYQTASTAILF